MLNRIIVTNIFIFLLLMLNSCQTDPEPIHYGSDACSMCKMIIVDTHFGSELISSKGKIYKFDSIECLVRYLKKNDASNTYNNRLLVTDHSRPNTFVEAQSASYLHSEKLPSPMGESLSAFESKDSLQAYFNRFGGEQLTWEDVRVRVK